MRSTPSGAGFGAIVLALLSHTSAALAGPYAPAAGQPGSTAIAKDSPSITAWATGHVNYAQGAGVSTQFGDPTKAYGLAEGNNFDIVSLGDSGQITLTFAKPITDGAGADFAVFENSFNDTFLELAWVEVSSDGTNFVRFANHSLTANLVSFLGGSIDPTNVDGLAGKYRAGFGTPFDLADVGLAQVTHVRLVDIIGDGTAFDSDSHVIYDPFPTSGSAGFDLDAVGVINQVPEPAAIALLALPLIALLRRRRAATLAECGVLAAMLTSYPALAATADFEDLSLAPSAHHDNGAFVSRGVGFSNTSSAFGWSGFAYSNQTDATTPGFANQHSAIAGGGAGGSANYGVAYYSAFDPIPTIALAPAATVQSISLTNTTYTYFSMRDGDAFAKKFGGAGGNDADWLKLTITGLDASNASVGSVDFYLADFRFSDNAQDYIVNAWTTVDLSSLSAARTLTFSMDSSDVGPFGVNTPTYVALDDLVAVPEPVGGALFALGAIGLLRRRHISLSPCSGRGQGRGGRAEAGVLAPEASSLRG
jgi:hypothetical protein